MYLCLIIAVLGYASPAMAYVGPGPGLAMLGSLVGLVFAVVMAILAVLAYPLYALYLRIRDHREAKRPPEPTTTPE